MASGKMSAHPHPSFFRQLIGGIFLLSLLKGQRGIDKLQMQNDFEICLTASGMRTYGRGRLINPANAKSGSKSPAGRREIQTTSK